MTNQEFQRILQPYLNDFSQEEGYFDDDEKRIAYFRQNPANEDAKEVVLKISTMEHHQIDQIIQNRQVMADHITSLRVDKALRQGSPEIVADIAHLEMRGKSYFLYSFATRFCNWHSMEAYPIYDLNIHQLLSTYWQEVHQENLLTDALYQYPHFKELMTTFRQEMDMENFNFKEVDKFVWIYGDHILRDFVSLQTKPT